MDDFHIGKDGDSLPGTVCTAKGPSAAALLRSTGLAGILLAASMGAAHAFEIDTGNSGWVTRWDNTVKYSAAIRTGNPKAKFLNDPNGDDSQRNFEKGDVISNRVDILSEFDTHKNGWGARVSGAAWYDSVYNQNTDNTSQSTFNPYSVPAGTFTDTTRRLHGRNIELMDAFAFGEFDLFGGSFSFRAGRHTLLWGSSLFYTFNGIASGQAPIDYIKAQSVPNSQAKELFMPVAQISAAYSITSKLSIAAYYQLEYRRNRFPAADSFFSFGDQLDGGGERLIFAPGLPGTYLYRGEDREPEDAKGQFGIGLKYSTDDADFGLFAQQYNAKSPILYMNSAVVPALPGSVGEYFLIYPEKIQAVGASVDTSLGVFNVGAELTFKHNNPLAAGGLPDAALTPGADADENALFAKGDTFHYQVSGIAVTPPTFFQDGGSVAFEVAAERLIKVTHGSQYLASNATRNGAGATVSYTANYYQVLPSIDLSIPVTVGYNFVGAGATGNFGRGGNVTVGLNGTYNQIWNAGVSYTRYVVPSYGLENLNAGRDFVAFNVRTTF